MAVCTKNGLAGGDPSEATQPSAPVLLSKPSPAIRRQDGDRAAGSHGRSLSLGDEYAHVLSSVLGLAEIHDEPRDDCRAACRLHRQVRRSVSVHARNLSTSSWSSRISPRGVRSRSSLRSSACAMTTSRRAFRLRSRCECGSRTTASCPWVCDPNSLSLVAGNLVPFPQPLLLPPTRQVIPPTGTRGPHRLLSVSRRQVSRRVRL